MGSGGSVLTDSLKDASPAQVAETFGTLSAEDKKKVASALANVGEQDAPKEAAPEKKGPTLSEEQRNMLKAAFEEIDKDKSRAIEANELKAVMAKMNVPLSEEQIDGVFKRADVNKDAKLSFEEYESLVLKSMNQ
ncbi:unnamed protein product [Effrenium voratum]|nr:unnamed protein product [Effrenium voratum]